MEIAKSDSTTILSKKKKISIWNKSASLNAGAFVVGLILIVAFFPSFFTSNNPISQNADVILQAPSAQHLFGTDHFGRDIFSRVIYGTRIDLTIGVLATMVPFISGSIIGLVAGYYGGWIDSILMRILDIFMAFPFIVLVIAIVAILGPGINNLYIAIWLVGWKDYARLVRSEVMVAKNEEYVQAAKILGFKDIRILLKHILPNVFSVAIVFAAADIVMCMLSGASLSFLGLGVQPPEPEWGSIISEGRAYLSQAWWICTFPGIALVIAGTGFSLLGDGLSDLLRTKGR